MKSLTEYLWFETPHPRDYINITEQIEKLVQKSEIQEGLCLELISKPMMTATEDTCKAGQARPWGQSLQRACPHGRNESLPPQVVPSLWVAVAQSFRRCCFRRAKPVAGIDPPQRLAQNLWHSQRSRHRF